MSQVDFKFTCIVDLPYIATINNFFGHKENKIYKTNYTHQ